MTFQPQYTAIHDSSSPFDTIKIYLCVVGAIIIVVTSPPFFQVLTVATASLIHHSYHFSNTTPLKAIVVPLTILKVLNRGKEPCKLGLRLVLLWHEAVWLLLHARHQKALRILHHVSTPYPSPSVEDLQRCKPCALHAPSVFDLVV